MGTTTVLHCCAYKRVLWDTMSSYGIITKLCYVHAPHKQLVFVMDRNLPRTESVITSSVFCKDHKFKQH